MKSWASVKLQNQQLVHWLIRISQYYACQHISLIIFWYVIYYFRNLYLNFFVLTKTISLREFSLILLLSKKRATEDSVTINFNDK